MTNIELGYKTSHERFVVFATLFRTEFDNVSFNDIDLSGTPRVRTTGTRTSGIELEGVLLPVDALTIRFSITLQDPKYRDFRFRDAAGNVIDNTGNTIRRIPEAHVARHADVRLPGGPRPRVPDLDARGRPLFERREHDRVCRSTTSSTPACCSTSAAAGLFQLTGDNLTDEVGLTEGNPRTDVGAGASGSIYIARPLFGRSFMGSVTYRY